MELDGKLFRQTLGLFATGVAIIATETEGQIHGMTVNAVSSVSLEPPLVLFCPGKRTRFASLLPALRSFSVNFLRADQQALSSFFAGGWKESAPPPFRFVHDGEAPRLQGALATLDCTLHAMHEAGDHWVVIGQVQNIQRGTEPHVPLLFFKGQYRNLESGSAAAGPDFTAVIDEPPYIYYD